MKTLSSASLAILGKRLAMTQLVELQLSAPIRLASCRDSIVWNGNTFIGGKQTAMDPIKNQGGEVVGLKFQLSGVPADNLALALAENVQGRPVHVWIALMDPDTQQLLDVIPSWSGTCDQMPITQTINQATITVTAEHRGITFARPKGYKYTDGDQQKLFPGDKCLQYIVAQASHQDVWPAAAFFYQ